MVAHRLARETCHFVLLMHGSNEGYERNVKASHLGAKEDRNWYNAAQAMQPKLTRTGRPIVLHMLSHTLDVVASSTTEARPRKGTKALCERQQGRVREKGVQRKEHARHGLALQRMEEGEFLNRGKAVCA
jgi:hypothetical protein